MQPCCVPPDGDAGERRTATIWPRPDCHQSLEQPARQEGCCFRFPEKEPGPAPGEAPCGPQEQALTIQVQLPEQQQQRGASSQRRATAVGDPPTLQRARPGRGQGHGASAQRPQRPIQRPAQPPRQRRPEGAAGGGLGPAHPSQQGCLPRKHHTAQPPHQRHCQDPSGQQPSFHSGRKWRGVHQRPSYSARDWQEGRPSCCTRPCQTARLPGFI